MHMLDFEINEAMLLFGLLTLWYFGPFGIFTIGFLKAENIFMEDSYDLFENIFFFFCVWKNHDI